jgi:hypothetical protein
VTVEANAEWERHPGGAYISVPIDPRDLDEVRAWCNGNCIGDFLIVLDRRVLFQSREDAALATMFWRCEER